MCYLGIIPGQTDWAVALTVLHIHMITWDDGTYSAESWDTTHRVRLTRDGGADQVFEIDIEFQRALPTFGGVILHYGRPCAMIENIHGAILLEYPSMIFFTADSVISPATAIARVDIQNNGVTCQTPINPWTGFTSLRGQ
jgi:hypothetical protein